MYKSFWTPILGKALVCEVELGYIGYPYAVGVHRPSTTLAVFLN